ncbi:MAG: sensor domain-containing diguanylate cyclase [Candidatus Omnitrophota bacterium]|nr:sensor domain-containing diguanylate cyclase [Candidatus Omnitrophota bacterium]
MTPLSKKAGSGILSIALFISLAYLLSRLASNVMPGAPLNVNLAASAISAFNIAILLSWLAFGIAGGAVMTALSFIAVLWLMLREGAHWYSVYMLTFLATTYLGYICSSKGLNAAASHKLKLEKLGEDVNILSHETAERRDGIKALEDRLERYSTLESVVESLSTLLSLDDITKNMIEKAKKIINPGGRALLFLVDTEKQALKLVASDGSLPILTKTGDTFDMWVLRSRKSLLIEDITKDFRFSADNVERAKGVFRSLIAVPLISEDKVIGLFRMDAGRDRVFKQDDLRLLDIIANLGAVVIQNALLYAKTQEYAIKDGLTGLAIRRYFLERFQEEMKRSAIRKGKLSILMLDIDYFKDYNDKYGHAAGDLVLKHLAKVIGSLAREGDIVARYGGEEIVVLLCGRSRKEAATEAENLRKLIRKEPLTLRRHATNITVSIGLSSYPEDGMSQQELIGKADERLYKAKAGGRDRVCSS